MTTQSNPTFSTHSQRKEKRALTLPNHILHDILTTRAMPHEHDLPPRPQVLEVLHTLRKLRGVLLQGTGAPPAVGGGEQNLCDGPVCGEALRYC